MFRMSAWNKNRLVASIRGSPTPSISLPYYIYIMLVRPFVVLLALYGYTTAKIQRSHKQAAIKRDTTEHCANVNPPEFNLLSGLLGVVLPSALGRYTGCLCTSNIPG